MHSIQEWILRWEAMSGLCGWYDEADPALTERDIASFGREYGARQNANGTPMRSAARTVRFLVEIGGFSYNDALGAVVEDRRSFPTGERRTDLDPAADAQRMLDERGDVIEALYELKVIRLAAYGNEEAEYSMETAKALMSIERPDRQKSDG